MSRSESPVRAAIEAQNAAFGEAVRRADADRLAALYTRDALVVAPGAPIARGTAAIAAFWKAGLEGVKDARLVSTAVEDLGDTAIEDGNAELRTADGATARARYLVVWKREAGVWKLHRDIWNSES